MTSYLMNMLLAVFELFVALVSAALAIGYYKFVLVLIPVQLYAGQCLAPCQSFLS